MRPPILQIRAVAILYLYCSSYAFGKSFRLMIMTDGVHSYFIISEHSMSVMPQEYLTAILQATKWLACVAIAYSSIFKMFFGLYDDVAQATKKISVIKIITFAILESCHFFMICFDLAFFAINNHTTGLYDVMYFLQKLDLISSYFS
jgi:hypothetical protein